MLAITDIDPPNAVLGILLQCLGVFLLTGAYENIKSGIAIWGASAISRSEHPFAFWFMVLMNPVFAGVLSIISGVWVTLT